jgi:hypothetical protein
MNPDPKAVRAEQLRRAVLDFLATRMFVAFEPATILFRITHSRLLDFIPEPDELTAALTFLENFTPEPLIRYSVQPLGSTRFYQVTSAGVLAFERGAFNP